MAVLLTSLRTLASDTEPGPTSPSTTPIRTSCGTQAGTMQAQQIRTATPVESDVVYLCSVPLMPGCCSSTSGQTSGRTS